MEEHLRKLQLVLEGNDGFIQLLGIKFCDHAKDYAKSSMKIEKKHMNPNGTVQGGCLYAMADSTGVAACAWDHRIGPTINGELYFMHATNGASELFCECRLAKNGKTLKIVEAQITDDLGRLIAKGTMQYYISMTIEDYD